MHSKHLIASKLSRIAFGLVILTGGLMLLIIGGSGSLHTGAKTQEQGRIVTRKPWRVEPVQVVAAKNKRKANIELDKTFDDDDDWLDGFTVTVLNNSDKTVTAMTIEMIFRREPGDSRPPVAQALHFGPSPIAPGYIYRDRSKVISVGKTADLR